MLQIIIDGLGRVLCISQTKPAHYENAGNDDDDGGASSGKPSPTWLTMAQILDRLFFWVYCLAYIIMAIAFAAIRSQWAIDEGLVRKLETTIWRIKQLVDVILR